MANAKDKDVEDIDLNNFKISYVDLITKIDDKKNNFKSLEVKSWKPLYDMVFKKDIKSGIKKSSAEYSEDEIKEILKTTPVENKLKTIMKIFDKTVDSGCSIYSLSENHSSSCLPTFALEDMVKSIDNDYYQILKSQHSNNQNDYRKLLSLKLKEYYNLKDDKDYRKLLENDQIKGSEKTKKAIELNIKPFGPIGKEWLSNIEIEQLLKQNEAMVNKDKIQNLFYFGGVYPIDFFNYDDYEINKFLETELKNSNHKYSYIGLVLNHDKRNMGGSHWVAMFIDIPNLTVYYYDSVGEKPKKLHYTFIDKLNSLVNAKFKIEYNHNKRQTSGGDCGVYACCFIIILSRSIPNVDKEFKNYLKLTLKPDFINSIRKLFFIDEKLNINQ